MKVLTMTEAECNTYTSGYADGNGMYELTDEETECYQIIQKK